MENCGLFAVYNHPDALALTHHGLMMLQHRGQESAGIAWIEDGQLHRFRGMGLVKDVFSTSDAETLFWKKSASIAIGHVRYSTSAGSKLDYAQPLLEEGLALGHNGTIHSPHFPSGCNDTQALLQCVLQTTGATLEQRITQALAGVEGAYCVEFLAPPDRLIAVRDPRGFRPLVLGTIGEGYILSSESCVFETNLLWKRGAKYKREVYPGEMLRFEHGKRLASCFPFPYAAPTPCIFEFAYVAHPASSLFGIEEQVHTIRYRLGRRLGQKAKELGIEADLVVPVPNSGRSAAHGVADELGLPQDEGIIKNTYLGRGFIEPHQQKRNYVKDMMVLMRGVLKGKRVILVDDSLVRGTTLRELIRDVRAFGAMEVHVVITFPPYSNPCFFGVDTPRQEDLSSYQAIQKHGVDKALEAERQLLDADSLIHNSIEDLKEEIPGSYCTACATGQYPLDVSTLPVRPTPQPTILQAKKP